MLREAITRVSSHVNNGGWRVVGYYKSSASDEMVTQEVHHVRICCLLPAVVIPDNLKYQIVQAEQRQGEPPRLVHGNTNVINDVQST